YCNGPVGCVDWARLPVDGASREDGEQFAAWLARSGRVPGARLCTDREWERAARGADDRRYPNGNGDPGPNDACPLDTYGGVVRVGLPAPAARGGRRAVDPFDQVAAEVEHAEGASVAGVGAHFVRAHLIGVGGVGGVEVRVARAERVALGDNAAVGAAGRAL